MTDEELKAVHNDLAPVVQAIENYKKDQTKYPSKLDELVPKYLATIPTTAGGRKYEYIGTSPDNRYNIRISSKNGGSYSGSCSYSEVEDEWKDIKNK